MPGGKGPELRCHILQLLPRVCLTPRVGYLITEAGTHALGTCFSHQPTPHTGAPPAADDTKRLYALKANPYANVIKIQWHAAVPIGKSYNFWGLIYMCAGSLGVALPAVSGSTRGKRPSNVAAMVSTLTCCTVKGSLCKLIGNTDGCKAQSLNDCERIIGIQKIALWRYKPPVHRGDIATPCQLSKLGRASAPEQ